MEFFDKNTLYPVLDIRKLKGWQKEPGKIPNKPGVYAWFFSSKPQKLPLEIFNFAHEREGKKLLYIGIAPGRKNSTKTLSDRIHGCHLNGSINNSTLRKSLTVLQNLHQRADRKSALDEWLDKYAHLCWVECDNPLELEKKLLSHFVCPLNIQGHREQNKFATELQKLRNTNLS